MTRQLPGSTLTALTRCLDQLGRELKAEAPAQHARAESLRRALKASRSVGPEARRVAKELLTFSLARRAHELERRRARLQTRVARGDQTVLPEAEALDVTLALLREAVLLGRAATPSAAGLARLTTRARQAELKVARAVTFTATGLVLKPVLTQPVSRSGARLRPAQPARRPAAQKPLAPFRVRPGVQGRG